jgi:hypothetical protein
MEGERRGGHLASASLIGVDGVGDRVARRALGRAEAIEVVESQRIVTNALDPQPRALSTMDESGPTGTGSP